MISHDHIIEHLKKDIATRVRLEPEQIEPDAHFVRDLGMSSLDLLNVLAFAEKHFSVRFPDELVGELTSLSKIIDAVSSGQIQQSVDNP